jgi:hypothetical protein
VKNKRVTHIRAKKKNEIEHIYDTEKKEIEGMMHAQRDSRINYLLHNRLMLNDDNIHFSLVG